jgi:hypothetical protein
MFAKTLLDTKHSMWFTPESQTELKLWKTNDKNNLKSVYFAFIHSIMS